LNAALQSEQAEITRTAEISLPSKFTSIGTPVGPQSLWRLIQRLPDNALDLMPRGWIHKNMAVSVQLIQQSRESFWDTNQNLTPGNIDRAAREIDKTLSNNRSPFYLLARIAIPNFTRAMQTCAFNQTQANEAQIACALERYKLANGNYPETLDALAPQFIKKIPRDLIGGQPLHYRRADDGKFILYSVGWNETDDGGVSYGPDNKTAGDWIWKN
jgi:hypothetical protein